MTSDQCCVACLDAAAEELRDDGAGEGRAEQDVEHVVRVHIGVDGTSRRGPQDVLRLRSSRDSEVADGYRQRGRLSEGRQVTSKEGVSFAERYGPWVLIVGASEGIGAMFAQALAGHGLNVLLVARRQAGLDEVAAAVCAGSSVEARTLAVDLTAEDAVRVIADATSTLEISMLVYCAGGDPNYEPFLSQPIENAMALVQRNCVVPMRLCHHFAAPMQERGHGGIVVVSSGAGLVGGRNMVAYGASKAFDMVMAEALWAELHSTGIDVLGVVLGVTDTPALRRTLLRRGQLADPDEPIPGASTAEAVVAETLANLSSGPTCFATEDVREGVKHLGAMSRNDAARFLLQLDGGVMGHDKEAPI